MDIFTIYGAVPVANRYISDHPWWRVGLTDACIWCPRIFIRCCTTDICHHPTDPGTEQLTKSDPSNMNHYMPSKSCIICGFFPCTNYTTELTPWDICQTMIFTIDPDWSCIMLGFHTISSLFNYLIIDLDFGIMLGFHTISSLFNYLIIDPDFGIMLGFHTISLLFNNLIIDPDFGIMLGFHTN